MADEQGPQQAGQTVDSLQAQIDELQAKKADMERARDYVEFPKWVRDEKGTAILVQDAAGEQAVADGVRDEKGTAILVQDAAGEQAVADGKPREAQ